MLYLLTAIGCLSASFPAAALNFIVTNSQDSGEGSLRAALTLANATPFGPGQDRHRILFDIPGDGVHTIRPLTPLPPIARTLTLDGYSQPGAVPNSSALGSNAVLRIQIANSENLPEAALAIRADDTVVRGLVLFGFGTAIRLGESGVGGVHGVQVAGNRIGVDASGTQRGTRADNIRLSVGSTGNLIGGPTPAERNQLCSASDATPSIVLIDSATRFNTVENNLFGIAADGATSLNCRGVAVHVLSGSQHLIARNRIRNTLAGLLVSGPTTRGVDLHANEVVSSFGIGIDLKVLAGAQFNNGDGVTANDPDDADDGPNGLQNFPELLSASPTGAGLELVGRLDVPPGQAREFRLDFFANAACHASGHGPAETYLGGALRTVGDPGGELPAEEFFLATLPLDLPEGRFVVATATDDSEGNTSELSACVAVSARLFGSGFEADFEAAPLPAAADLSARS